MPANVSPKAPSAGLQIVSGLLTHRAVATCLTGDIDQLEPGSFKWAATVASIADGVVGSHPKLGSHRSRIRMLVTTATGAYLQRWVPPGPVRFVAAEVPVGHGRVDLVWEHPDLGVFFDEIKTSRLSRPHESPSTIEQVLRYAADGQAKHGQEFAGVRLIPILSPHCSRLALSGATTLAPLTGSALDFTDHPRGEAA